MSCQKLYAQSWLFQVGKGINSFQREKFVLLFVLILFTLITSAQKITDPVRLNQVGYYPNSSKLAVITDKIRARDFYVVSTDEKDTLYQGFLSQERKSAYSSTITRIADFTSFTTPGNYILRVANLQQSFPFEIKNEVYTDLGKALLKSFYYQRSSITLDEKYAGKWNRTADYADNAVFIHASATTDNRPAGTVISVSGGWYDGGDCNKYIVSSGITMGTLLSAYEDFSNRFDTLNTNIPESNDKIPDILNEILYNLRWMLTMCGPKKYCRCT